MECSICFNDLTDNSNNDLFYFECCNNYIHYTCLLKWINTNIDNSFSDYNKCIICKSYNILIDDCYKNIINYKKFDTYCLDISNNYNYEDDYNIRLPEYIIIDQNNINCFSTCIKYIIFTSTIFLLSYLFIYLV